MIKLTMSEGFACSDPVMCFYRGGGQYKTVFDGYIGDLRTAVYKEMNSNRTFAEDVIETVSELSPNGFQASDYKDVSFIFTELVYDHFDYNNWTSAFNKNGIKVAIKKDF